jgi:hypothetical protein
MGMGRNCARGRSLAKMQVFAAFFLLHGVPVALAGVDALEISKHQAVRDSLFKNLKTATTQYTFDYLVIYLAPGTLPGVDVRVPVSHIRFRSTVFFAFDRYSLEPSEVSKALVC